MTVKELIEFLKQYPGEAIVRLDIDPYPEITEGYFSLYEEDEQQILEISRG